MKTATTLERRDALREALANAAERRIAQSGYAALRARDLADDVGCAIGAIYLVFADLDSLIVAVKDRTLHALEAEAAKIAEHSPKATDESVAAARKAADNLTALAALYLRFAHDNRNLWRALFEHRAPAGMPSNALSALDAIFAHIERQIRVLAPGVPAARRRLLAQALFGAAHGIVALGLNDLIEKPSVEEVAWQARTIVQLIARGLSGAADLADLNTV
jgi:AcrR family transcriptional regulator